MTKGGGEREQEAQVCVGEDFSELFPWALSVWADMQVTVCRDNDAQQGPALSPCLVLNSRPHHLTGCFYEIGYNIRPEWCDPWYHIGPTIANVAPQDH